MVKPLTFKGDKRPKKRKHEGADSSSSTTAAAPPPAAAATAEDDGGDDSWVSADRPSDVSGPVMLVLAPTLLLQGGDDDDDAARTAVAALACDARGAVFASRVENLVDGRPATAEPHEVRQVWVARNAVPGQEGIVLRGVEGK